MRVLLTGASGFLGAHLLRRYLIDTDWDFVCPVTFRNRGVPERVSWALDESEQQGRVDVVVHDCATPVGPITAERFGDIDLVLNLASDTHPPRSVLEPVQFVHNNVDIALYLLEYARDHGKPTFVQFSTNSVYGPAYGDSSHPEWDSIIPNNPYGASKAAQEALAIAYWRSYRMPVVIAATMNPIGVTQDLEKYIPMTVRNVLLDETTVVHVDKDGAPGARAYIDAEDVADGLRHIVEKLPPTAFGPGVDRPDRWNICNDQHEIDNVRAGTLIAMALGRRFKHRTECVDRPEHGHRYSMSGAKLAAAGWAPSRNTVATIEHIAQWSAQNPDWLIG